MRFRRVLALTPLLLALSALPGCFLFFLLGNETVSSLSDQIDLIFAAIDARATTSICLADDSFEYSCIYIIDGEQVGSSTRLISELGLFGVIIDPLVLELPDDVTDIVGHFDDGGANSGDLLVYPQLQVVPVDDSRSFVAAPGKQLVVVELPPGAPVDEVTYDFSLGFQRVVPAGTGPTPLRALFTARVEAGGKVFYPPLYPCTTDLASLPELSMPRGSTMAAIELPSGQPVCQSEVYTYFHSDGQQGKSCDLDNDTAVDVLDLDLIMAARNMDAAPGDPRDVNDDGRIDANDARHCTARCTLPQCAQFF